MRKMAIDGLIIKSIIKRDQIVSIYSTLLEYGYPIPTIKVTECIAIFCFFWKTCLKTLKRPRFLGSDNVDSIDELQKD